MDIHKALQTADKLLAEGAYDQALREYEKILAAEPASPRTLERLGHLYLRKGDTTQAGRCLAQAAEGVQAQGLLPNAIGLYKQVLEVDPHRQDVNVHLARLHQRLGRVTEAMQYFERAAAHFRRLGDTQGLRETLDRMIDLAPDRLSSNMLEWMLELDPSNDKARRLLEKQAAPSSAETVRNLIKKGASYEADRIFPKAVEFYEQALALDPQHPEVMRKLTELYHRMGLTAASYNEEPAQPRPIDPVPKLLSEIDLYLKYGLREKALEHLEKLFAIAPENLNGHEKAYHLYVETGNTQRAYEQLLTLLRLCARHREVMRGQCYLDTLRQQSPDHPELPGFLAALGQRKPK